MDFMMWIVRIVIYVFRIVYIRKVWCILDDSQLMELKTRIKVELGTLCELRTRIKPSSSLIIF